MNGEPDEWAIGLHGAGYPKTTNDAGVMRLNQIFEGIKSGTMLKGGNERAVTTRQAY